MPFTDKWFEDKFAYRAGAIGGLNPKWWTVNLAGASIEPSPWTSIGDIVAQYRQDRVSVDSPGGICRVSTALSGSTWQSGLFHSRGKVMVDAIVPTLVEVQCRLSTNGNGELVNWQAPLWLYDFDTGEEVDVTEGMKKSKPPPATAGRHTFHPAWIGVRPYDGPVNKLGAEWPKPAGGWGGVHTYGVIWKAGSLQWLLDGVEVSPALANKSITAKAKPMVFDTAVAGYGGPSANGTMQIMRITVWKWRK